MRRLSASVRNGFLHICVIQLANLNAAVFSLQSPDAPVYISVLSAGEIKRNQTPDIHLILAIRLRNCRCVTVWRKWKRINLITH